MPFNFPDAPVTNQTYTYNNRTWTYDGTAWNLTSGTLQGVTIAASAPSSPRVGDLWFDSRIAQLFVYYNDGDSSQWVAASGGTGAFLSLYGGTVTGSVVIQADTQVRSLNGGPLAGFRNHVMNGDFRFNQRGATTITTDGNFPVDRWKTDVGGTGASRTAQRVALTDSDRSAIGRGNALWALQYAGVGTSSGGDLESLTHCMEGAGLLAGRTITLSFWARRTSGTGNIATEFSQRFGTGGSPSANVDGIGGTIHTLTTGWQRFTVTTTVPSVAGKTFGSNGDDYFFIRFYFSAGSNFNTRLGGALGAQTLTAQIADVQVEIGSDATPFELRPPQVELALCQRYYEVVNVQSLVRHTTIGTYGGAIINIGYRVTKRVAPTQTVAWSGFNRSGTTASLLVNGSTVTSSGNFSFSGLIDQITVWNGGGLVNAGDYATGSIEIFSDYL